MSSANLAAALALAAQGIAVFPCNPTKRPQPGIRWKDEATTDRRRIEAWWRRWPDSLPAFEPGRHKLAAIDCDRHGKSDGVEALVELARAHDDDPRDWPTIETPSTGRHIFFRQDGSLTNARGTLPAGIDVRGSGGYVIAEGAELPDGRSYHPLASHSGLVEVLAADALPEVPAWLLALLTPRTTDTTVPPEKPAGGHIERPRTTHVTTPSSGGGQSEFFRKVNDAGLARLDAWAPELFPRARHQPGTGAYRVTSRDLGRDLQEDLSLAPTGIVDFGVADMGDARAGKRTPIDIVMEHGGAPDAVAAARWLCDRLGIDAAAQWDAARSEPDIEIRILTQPAGDATDDLQDDADDEPEEARPIDESLTHVGGVLGDIVNWIASCDPQGNRLLALAAALPLMSTLLGRRMATPTREGGGLELYVVSLLPSGDGKSVAMAGITRLLEVAGLDNMHLAPPKFRSGAAFGDVLCRMPLSISIIDEIADYLATFTSDKRQGHQAELEEYLKEQWGKGFQSFRTAHSKTSSSTKTFAPCYSIYGVTAPESFFRSIKSSQVTSGFINRFTIINADGAARPHKSTGNVRHPPDRLIESVRAMYALGSTGRGNLSSFIDKNNAVDPEPVVVQWESQDASDFYDAFEADCNMLKVELGDFGKIYARTAFMAIKLATIRACGDYGLVTLDSIRWGAALARQSADLFKAELAGRMLDPLNAGELLQRVAQQFLKPTAKGRQLMDKYGPMTLPKRFLWNALKHHTNRHPGEFDGALKAMESGGEIKIGKLTVAGAKDAPVVQYLRRRKAAA